MSAPADADVSMPSPDLDPLFASVTPIKYPAQDGHATGFYFRDANGNYFLITNNHVVATDEGSPIADSIRVLTRPSPDIGDVEFREVSLEAGGDPTWIQHPRGSMIDVVAVPLEFDIGPMTTTALDSGLFPPAEGRMPTTQRAMIVGYPMLERTPYRPVRRDAMISSLYGTTYRGLPCFKTDADMHSGTSGSPVFALPSAAAQRDEILGEDLYLIGVHSATLFSDHPPREGSLDLNIAWYIQLLEDMLVL